MAIVFQSPPEDGPQKLRTALRDLRRQDDDDLLGGAQIDLSHPIPIFTLRLDEIRGNNFLDMAHQSGWRYILGSDKSAAFADIKRNKMDEHYFSSLARNSNADRLVEAAHLAEDIAKKINDDCEPRILEIPAIHLSAFWLKSNNSLFIPFIDPAFIGNNKDTIQVMPNFIEHVENLAAAAKSSNIEYNMGLPHSE